MNVSYKSIRDVGMSEREEKKFYFMSKCYGIRKFLNKVSWRNAEFLGFERFWYFFVASEIFKKKN